MANEIKVIGWALAVASGLVTACHDEPHAQPTSGSAGAPVASGLALDRLRAWVAAVGAKDVSTLVPALADGLIVRAGDPPLDLTSYGREKWRESTRGASPRHCELQLGIASGPDAVGIALCTITYTVKRAPTERTSRLLRAYEVHLDPEGTIDQVVLWFDTERHGRQLGADLAVPAEPDGPWASPVQAVARNDATETANVRAATEMVEALSRKDVSAVVRHVAPRFELHEQQRVEPRVFDPESYARALTDELASFAASAYQLRSVIAAGDWVAVRFGHGYRLTTGPEAHTLNLWLVRFAGGAAVEAWAFSSRYSEALQTGRLKDGELAKKINGALQ